MPTYDVHCPNCGIYERFSWKVEQRRDPCEKCGAEVDTVQSLGTKTTGFEPYFDIGLGVDVNGAGDRRAAMRKLNADYREPPSLGDRSARADRINETKKRQRQS